MSDQFNSRPPSFHHPLTSPDGNNAIGFCSQIPMGHDNFDETQPFKKPRYSNDGHPNPPQDPLLSTGAPPSVNPPQSSKTMFFKTRLCNKFNQGSCPYGSKCHFAHGNHELRTPPSNWEDIVAQKQSSGNSSAQPRNHRTGICKKFYSGQDCPYGDKCVFRHESPSGPPGESSAVNKSSPSEGPYVASAHLNSKESSQRPAPWKTQMCHKWFATGHCAFGEHCNFAHGHLELKKHGDYPVPSSVDMGAVPTRYHPSPNEEGAAQSKPEPIPLPQPKQQNAFPRWKVPKKIIGIYGDWID